MCRGGGEGVPGTVKFKSSKVHSHTHRDTAYRYRDGLKIDTDTAYRYRDGLKIDKNKAEVKQCNREEKFWSLCPFG